MAAPADVRLRDQFRTRVDAGSLPARPAGVRDAPVSREAIVALLDAQLTSRHLDYAARRLGREKRTYYSIASAGHEGNAAVASGLRHADMAFLHYRSGAFLVARMRQRPQTLPAPTPIWDMALSFAARAEDPCSGGRHKVLGSKLDFVPPQTSTIASHLPKAVGAAVGVAMGRKVEHAPVLPDDAVILASFGDASANHASAQTAINAAAWTAARGAPLPLIFLCEDNGIGISVPTPEGWIAQSFANRKGLAYLICDGRDVADTAAAAAQAAHIARSRRKPVFLHMRCARLMGHAGSDVEEAYRDASAIAAAEADDPLLHTARAALDAGVTAQDLLALDAEIEAQVARALDIARARPVIASAAEAAAPVIPPQDGAWTFDRPPARPVSPAPTTPLTMNKIIAHTLSELMEAHPDLVVFGEDVGRKGGVYGATAKLQERHGPARVFDTLLDETTILGLAIGLAQTGFLPIPEIQFLAYLHNAEDQLRGEAATLSFFSNGQFANPMVVRVAGLGYQKGFGGHFHNDNALAVLRDIPGLVVLCPSTPAQAALTLREAVRLAREEGRVVVHLEPIALYAEKDALAPGDGLFPSSPPSHADAIAPGAPRVEGQGRDLCVISYANGAHIARRALARLAAQDDVHGRLVDLRWLSPLPFAAVREQAFACDAVLVVDECRRSGSPSEALLADLLEAGYRNRVARITGEDVFVPLGPAATIAMPSVDSVLTAARALVGVSEGVQAAQ